jgi:hypothetical protein
MAGVIVVALAERVGSLHRWPNGFRVTLDYDSANAARTIFLHLTSNHLPWQNAWLAANVGRFIEPPITQALTALTYLPDGVERPWTATLFTTAFWFVGAGFLYVAVRQLVGHWPAVLSAGFLLVAPFAVVISESFQPEALVVMAFAVVIWYAVRGDVIEGRHLVIAAVIGALAGLTKPGPLLPFIVAVFVASAARGGSLHDRRRQLRLLGLLAAVTLPAVLYALFLLPDQVESKLLPQLLVQRAFYLGWLNNAVRVVGIIPILGAALGFAFSRTLRPFGVLLGLAYLGYSALFTWHTMTHDYYQVPLLVIVALGLAGLVEASAAFAGRGMTWRRWAIVTGLGTAAAITWALTPSNLLEAKPGYFPEAIAFEAVGSSLGAGERVIAYSAHSGYPLMFYGKIIVADWPSPDGLKYLAVLGQTMTNEQRLQMLMKTTNPHFFVIIAPPSHGPSIGPYLAARYPLVEQGPNLQVYDLTRPVAAAT